MAGTAWEIDEVEQEFEDISEIQIKDSPEPKKKKTSYLGAAKYKCKFKNEWSKTYPVKAVPSDPYSFQCIPYMKKLRCSHQGLKDLKDHCLTEAHKKMTKSSKMQPSVSGIFSSAKLASMEEAVTKAEVLTTNFIIQHNLPIATSDHLGPLFKAIFPDSEIAKQYACGRTKTSAIINKAMGPYCHEYIVDHCKTHPFSLGLDGSSDTDLHKMNPATMRIFDINRNKIIMTHFYDMCITTGEDASKASNLFEVLQAKIEVDGIPWSQAVSLSVDNTNSMIGTHNSLASRCKAKKPEMYVMGCPCHLAHIAAGNAHDEFSKITGVNVEERLIDLYYWFEKSTKRKGVLVEYMDFCGQEYGKILKHSSTRWLSLERCIERTLKKYNGLKSYFLSESFQEARFQRLHKAFENPITEVVLFFHNASIPIFTIFNKLLQSDEPLIHVVHDSVNKLANTLANRIIKPLVRKNTSLYDIDLDDQEIYIPINTIHLGGMTKFHLQKLLRDGDISQRDYDNVFKAAQGYFKAGLKYVLHKFPTTNLILKHARWINVMKRIEAKWENVEYFIHNFKSAVNGIELDMLYNEFCDYQTLDDEQISKEAWNEAKVIDGREGGEVLFHYRVDILWWYISHMTIPETSAQRFQHLHKVAELVLVLPHSNAGEERLFSMVRKNKTDSRSSLKLEGTLSNLLTMKLHHPEVITPCFKWTPDKELTQRANKAAKQYNNEHK